MDLQVGPRLQRGSLLGVAILRANAGLNSPHVRVDKFPCACGGHANLPFAFWQPSLPVTDAWHGAR